MCCSPFTSSFNCMSTVFRTEGISAFYRAYPTQLLMNIPFQASLVVTYGMTQVWSLDYINFNSELLPYSGLKCRPSKGSAHSLYLPYLKPYYGYFKFTKKWNSINECLMITPDGHSVSSTPKSVTTPPSISWPVPYQGAWPVPSPCPSTSARHSSTHRKWECWPP